MRTIEIGKKTITLDIGEEFRVKDLRKVQPLYAKHGENYVELSIALVEVLSTDPKKDIETVENMNVEEFTELADKISSVIFGEKEAEKKTTKSSGSTHKK